MTRWSFLGAALVVGVGCGGDGTNGGETTGTGGSGGTSQGGSAPGGGGEGGGGQGGQGQGGDAQPPTVKEASTYEVTVSTHVYGQGLSHSDWGSSETQPMDLVLDLYEPEGAPPGRPALIIIHGGGFTGGSRTQPPLVAFANHFTERGWVSISIDYRLAGHHGTVPTAWSDYIEANAPVGSSDQGYALYPAARDAKAAVRWLRANADTYAIDTNYLTAMGGSAGSFLTIMLGVTNEEDFRDEVPAADDPTLPSTNLAEGAGVHTLIDHWGGLAHLTILEGIDGMSRFDTTDAPVSIVHGTADPTVLFSEAEALRDAYTATGVPFAFHPLEGAGHGPWNATVDGQNLRELAMDFVVEQQGLTVE